MSRRELWTRLFRSVRVDKTSVFLFVGALLCAFVIVGAKNGYRLVSGGSGPDGLYRVIDLESEPLRRNLWVEVCLEDEPARLAVERDILQPGKGSCANGLEPMLKEVFGMEGDRIDVERLPEPFETDGLGRRMDILGPPRVQVEPGEIWIRSIDDSRGAFDSKYFGPVPVGWVRSAVYAIWVD